MGAIPEISGLLTALAMNMSICALLVSLYSILRNQSSNRGVYFARTIAQMRSKPQDDPHWFDRFVPSPRWIVRAYNLTEDEILEIGGLDAVVFIKILVLSLRIFSVAVVVCFILVLPLNYLGKDVTNKSIRGTSLEIFTIRNIPQKSNWLWAHCLALYLICGSTWILLYFEYKDVAKMRLSHLRESFRSPSQFTVLVRGIPRSNEDSYNTTLRKFFMRYYPSSYISHQMVYRCGKIVKLMREAEKMYDIFSVQGQPALFPPGNFGEHHGGSLKMLSHEQELEMQTSTLESEVERSETGMESGAAFVFFRTRFAAATVAQGRQSSNPMLWVTCLAPEPNDVYWSNLCVPYRQIWLRRLATIMATTALLFFFLAPVTLVQGLANLDQFQRAFPFLKGVLKNKSVNALITGYLPGLILMLFLYTVPPLMMLISTLEGFVSRSGRKKAACVKVLHFNIWNVFFVNLASGTVLNKWTIISAKDIPAQLADRAIPALIKFFMTYVLTSGWTSLAIELAQLYPIIVNFLYKIFTRKEQGLYDSGYTFPYHTEIPRVLLFTLLGFTFAILAPLILPLLVIYFSLASVIYRNQILNVYLFQYDTGGKYWPMVHDTIIFSMVLAQILAIGVFATKQAPTCTMFTTLLVLFTLLFNEFCRQRFLPAFQSIAALDLIEMDREDEKTGRDEVYKKLQSSYSQNDWVPFDSLSRSSRHSTHPLSTAPLTAANFLIQSAFSTPNPGQQLPVQGQPLPQTIEGQRQQSVRCIYIGGVPVDRD